MQLLISYQQNVLDELLLTACAVMGLNRKNGLEQQKIRRERFSKRNEQSIVNELGKMPFDLKTKAELLFIEKFTNEEWQNICKVAKENGWDVAKVIDEHCRVPEKRLSRIVQRQIHK